MGLNKNNGKESLRPLHRYLPNVLRAGIEPARIASLVFETNASTNSAIGASLNCVAKVRNISDIEE